jgi:hypothetical protein
LASRETSKGTSGRAPECPRCGSCELWRAHEQWREQRALLAVARERWTDEDWTAARRLADAAWDAHRSNLYLYDAERALREQHYRRTAARLAAEARLDLGWLVGVMRATEPRRQRA